MNYCKYHPLEAATYYCPHCDIHSCDNQCINIERYYDLIAKSLIGGTA